MIVASRLPAVTSRLLMLTCIYMSGGEPDAFPITWVRDVHTYDFIYTTHMVYRSVNYIGGKIYLRT